MKRDLFKRFKETVKQADASDPIWYMGYLWLDLTNKQFKDLAYSVLSVHKDIEVIIDLHEGVYKYRLPNGLVLTLEPND